MTCPIANCSNPARWHNTLCADHARKVPQSIQFDVYRGWADFKRSKRPLMVLATARRYHQRLRDAVAAVTTKVVA